MTAGEIIFSGSLLLAIPIALAAGLLAFASPCVLPVVPGYIGLLGAVSESPSRRRQPVLAGVGAQDADAQDGVVQDAVAQDGVVGAVAAAPAHLNRGSRAASEVSAPAAPDRAASVSGPTESAHVSLAAESPRALRRRLAAGAILFVLGFAVIYVLSGAFIGQLGHWFLQYQALLIRILGVVVILMGLVFLGIAGPWQRTLRIHKAPAGLVGAPLLGAIFGVGWAPCIGPTLIAIQALSFNSANPWRGALLAFVYCLGLGIPFVLAAVFWNTATGVFGWLRRNIRTINIIGATLLIAIGLLMLAGVWQQFLSAVGYILPGYVSPL